MIPEPLPNAADHLLVGTAAQGPEPETPPEYTEGSAGEPELSREPGEHRAEYLWVPSCAPYRLLRRAASLPERFSWRGSDPYPVAVTEEASLTVRVKMDPLKGVHEEEDIEGLRAALLDGWTADALDAVAAKCLVAGRRGGVEVSHTDVLRARGLAESKASEDWGGRRSGWREWQTEPAKRALLQVASFSLRTQGHDHTGKEMPDALSEKFSRAFEFREVGEGRYNVKMGKAILHYLGGSAGSDQLELLDRRVLALRPRQDEVAKRLARYLSDMWRIRAKKGSMSGPWNVGKLLATVGLEADGALKPKRRLDSFRCALQTLEEVGVIGEIVEEFVEPTKRKGWTDEWLRSNVRIAPPPEVAGTYHRMFEEGLAVLGVVEGGSKEGSKARLGDRVRERREDLGWRQRQLAELLSVPQPTVARLEKGNKVRLSDEQKATLTEWLSGGAS